MAFPMFGKKEPEKMPSAGKGYVPIERIKDLATKGFSEPDMIDVMRKEGFSADEIDKALTEALKTGVSGITPPATQTVSSLPTLEQFQPPQPQVQQMPQMPETSLPEQYYQQQEYAPEEYVDYLVKERMSDVNEKMNEFMVRYDELEKRMSEVYNQMNALAKTKTGSEDLILSKIEGFKDVITDVDTRVDSLEKAFKETLPALIEAVRTLSDLVQRAKRES